jgi:antitoxin HicB
MQQGTVGASKRTTPAMRTQTRTFTVILEADRKVGGFTVLVPALPDCVTEGATVEEALANAKEAIELTVEDMLAHGDVIPDDPGEARIERVSVAISA